LTGAALGDLCNFKLPPDKAEAIERVAQRGDKARRDILTAYGAITDKFRGSTQEQQDVMCDAAAKTFFGD
jgi:dihydroorotase-like cyclic amidohydrolase